MALAACRLLAFPQLAAAAAAACDWAAWRSDWTHTACDRLHGRSDQSNTAPMEQLSGTQLGNGARARRRRFLINRPGARARRCSFVSHCSPCGGSGLHNGARIEAGTSATAAAPPVEHIVVCNA